MSELSLPSCPICLAKDSLSRQTMERAGKPFTWYECAECGSVLLWNGDDRWAYQKVGRPDKSHLLKQPMELYELQALLPSAKDSLPTISVSAEQVEKRREDKSIVSKLIPWLLILCLVGFLVLATAVILGAGLGPRLFSTATSTTEITPTPAFAAGDEVQLAKTAGGTITMWEMETGCELASVRYQANSGTYATVGEGLCYNANKRQWYHHVRCLGGGEGWVRAREMMPSGEYTPPPRPTPVPTTPPDLRSPFDKCVQSGSGVRYAISGSGVTRVALTWSNDTGGTNQGEYNLPICWTFERFESGDFLYISAQIVQGDGKIRCRIYDHSILIAEADASGFASIAGCRGSAVWPTGP